jgi:hypothetical protein
MDATHPPRLGIAGAKGKKMVKKSAQIWEVGEWVKVGFLTLCITAKEATPGDFAPDAYLLTDKTGAKVYRFVPHNGLTRLS